MNKINFSGKSLFVTALLAILFFAGCSKKKIDVVNGIPPVHAATAKQKATLESLKGKSPEQILAIINKDWPDLASGIISGLRARGEIKPAEEISSHSFFYGDSDAKGESGDGKKYAGRFEDQLIMKLNVAGRSKPLYVAVLCMNGMFDLKNSSLKEVGSMSSRFVIQKGENLVAHVGYESAVRLATKNKLPIIIGRSKHAKRIGLQQALRTNTNRHLVRVFVNPGDVVDLADMSYRPAQQR